MSTIIETTLSHLTNSPTPFHNCANLSTLLNTSGFEKLSEKEAWKGKLQRGGKYFFTRNGSTIVAFVVGGQYKAGEGGMKSKCSIDQSINPHIASNPQHTTILPLHAS
jgi:aspartyl aminopeptidase